MSTRAQIERDVALLLGEDATSPGFGEPLWLRRAVINATDEVARSADAYYTYYDMDLDGTANAPVERLCIPGELYKLKAVRVTQADGTERLFTEYTDIVTTAWMDRSQPTWRTDPRTGATEVVVVARPDFILYPRPTWTATAAVRLYGFGVPGEDWTTSGAVAGTDEFPLPEFCRPAVVYAAACLRCIQMPSDDNRRRREMLQAERDHHLGLACRDAQAEYSRRTSY